MHRWLRGGAESGLEIDADWTTAMEQLRSNNAVMSTQQNPLSPTLRTTIARGRARARTDRKDLADVLGAARVCHLGVVVDGTVRVLPTVFGFENIYALQQACRNTHLTAALEVVRSAGVHLGYLSDDEPTMFGAMITGADHMAAPTLASYTLGIVYHFFNGISFALVYSIVFGRTRWWGPVAFSVFVVWVGMMLLPPMAPMLGAFGTGKYASAWNPYVADTRHCHVNRKV